MKWKSIYQNTNKQTISLKTLTEHEYFPVMIASGRILSRVVEGNAVCCSYAVLILHVITGRYSWAPFT